jgi:hypothetical protein
MIVVFTAPVSNNIVQFRHPWNVLYDYAGGNSNCYLHQTKGEHMNTNLKIRRVTELDRPRKSGSE